MFFRLFLAMPLVLLCVVPFTFAQDTTVNVPAADTIGLIYFLPSDRTTQSDIDSTIDGRIKATQTAYADMMEARGHGRKTFSFQTDDNGNAVVHHITGDNTDEYYEDSNKWKVWDEIKEEGFDPSQNIYIAFVDLSSQEIDGWCGTGGDWTNANGGVVTLTVSGTCYQEEDGELRNIDLIAHELGHAFGLRHDYRDHSDNSIDAISDSMVTSVCAAKWLDGHRYFNDYTTSSTVSTTVEMATPSIAYPDVTISFTLTDADGFHQAQFFITRSDLYNFGDLSLLDCKSLSNDSTNTTIAFTASTLTSTTNSVTLRVMDALGSMTEKQFSVDLSLLADVNADKTVDTRDLGKIGSNLGQSGTGDINGDGVVNILDLILAANAMGNHQGAPSGQIGELEEPLTKANLQKWLREARQMNLTDPALQRGIFVLEQLLAAFTPTETALLPNYPNPFNPETWIPYQLAESADVAVSIYAADGTLVRALELGRQPVGIYKSRSRAAYWDGKNALGESVASGVYFYTLTAGDFAATRKMLIRK